MSRKKPMARPVPRPPIAGWGLYRNDGTLIAKFGKTERVKAEQALWDAEGGYALHPKRHYIAPIFLKERK